MKLTKIALLFSVFFAVACSSANYQYTAKPVSVGVSEDAPEDASITEIIAPYKEQLDAKMNAVIGEAGMDLTRVFENRESSLGNFCTNLIFEKAADLKPDLAVLTIGGLRVPIDKGEVTVRQMYELMPFENELVVITVKGEIVKSLIERVIEKDNTSLANVSATFQGGKLISAQIGGEPLDTSKDYRVATSDYLANGGDYMDGFKTASDRATANTKLREAFIDYFKELQENGKKAMAVTGKFYTFED